MRRGLMALMAAMALVSVGCTSSVQADCDTAEECGELKDSTFNYCIAVGNGHRDSLANDEDCKEVLEKFDDYYACRADLDCGDRAEAQAGKCAAEWTAFTNAQSTAGSSCQFR